MDVGAWLRGNSFAQYEAVFRDNEIDEEVLRDLTEGDLEKLGLPLGPRKRLLKAIANLPKTDGISNSDYFFGRIRETAAAIEALAAPGRL